MADGSEPQWVLAESERGRVVAIDSAYHVQSANAGRDVVVNASYNGVLPARFIAQHLPRAAIGVDGGSALDGSGIAGLWYFEALGMPAAAADVATVVLGDGRAMHDRAVISTLNEQARACGVRVGMSVREAARLLLDVDPDDAAASEITRREVVETHPSGRSVVVTDSIAFGLPEDVLNVLCTGGHTGRSSLPYLRRVRPHGFLCSDGGVGAEKSGIAGLALAAQEGLVGAAVSSATARMGDGYSTWADGVISFANELAVALGVVPGQRAADAARLMVEAEPRG